MARSRARGLTNVSFEAADAATLTSDQPFGVAFVFNAVHDQARPLEVLTSIRSILEPGKAWVFESTIDYGDGTPVSAVTIIEVGPDGKAARQRDYFAYPFEAPEWRAKFSESGEKLTAG